MNFVAFRRNIALFLVAVIVFVLAFRIIVAFIEVLLLALCLGVILFFGLSEDISAAWKSGRAAIQDAYAQWKKANTSEPSQ